MKQAPDFFPSEPLDEGFMGSWTHHLDREEPLDLTDAEALFALRLMKFGPCSLSDLGANDRRIVQRLVAKGAAQMLRGRVIWPG